MTDLTRKGRQVVLFAVVPLVPAIPLLPLIVADTGGSSVDFSVFFQYGVLGVVAVLLIFFAKNAHQRERDRADRLETENQRLHELILERVIPALASAQRAAEESAELLTAMQRERELQQLVQQRRNHEGGS